MPLFLSSPLPRALQERVLVADGAIGTVLRSASLSLDDLAGLEGCNEILNDTCPDVVEQVHRANLEVGADVLARALSTFVTDYGVRLVVLTEAKYFNAV